MLNNILLIILWAIFIAILIVLLCFFVYFIIQAYLGFIGLFKWMQKLGK
jgi:hypothetical protein